ncbi:hypothetical protein ASPWEDRAFT_149340 [Aspergillus wentii DTO 134E9]|uniref:Uncharacterized protein n=1 Tax=Aspergillus wentii DTO 134E9 TaxID=1073089 RepID=A0A1L9RV39_ASPWE|nr:uncharacterized protein ASPWEDRAFT_149340 [Aspergillus wentii DTO 134E9]OJJ38801.1 hypothetical protein ASPWEDRAFT_149340 [Aspergillus wentii DTO 134E9]
MSLLLPEVKAVSLGSRLVPKSKDVDVSNDYGTPNLLFLYYVPFLPDERKADLDAIQDEFQSWNAWELGQTETQVNEHLADGKLPSDDSIASRVARNGYRAKVVTFFRENSEGSLTPKQTLEDEKDINATPESVHGIILQELLTHYVIPNDALEQFGVVLRAISGSIDIERVNQFFFTHVYYKYDADQKRFLPDVRDTSFTVSKKQDGNPKYGKDDKDNFTVAFGYHDTVYSFDRKFWREHRHEAEEAIAQGEPIRKQMSLEFYVKNG